MYVLEENGAFLVLEKDGGTPPTFKAVGQFWDFRSARHYVEQVMKAQPVSVDAVAADPHPQKSPFVKYTKRQVADAAEASKRDAAGATALTREADVDGFRQIDLEEYIAATAPAEAVDAREPVKATEPKAESSSAPSEDDADFEAGILKPIDEAILKALPEAMARSPMGVTAAELSVITGATLRVIKTAITRLVKANRIEHIIAVVPPVVRPIDWRRPKADNLPPLATEIYKWLHRNMNEARVVKATITGMELHFQTKVDAALAELVKRRMIAYRRSIIDNTITLEVL